MLAIRQETQQALLDGTANCNLVLTFSDGTVIDNENITAESMNVKESVCEESELQFGNLYATEFSVQTLDNGVNHEGQAVVAVLQISDEYGNRLEDVRIGSYTVKSNQRSADKIHRNIVAYDRLADILITNVMPNVFETEGANPYVTGTLGELSTKILESNGFEDILMSIPNSTPNIALNFNLYNASSLSGADFFRDVLSLMGAFAYLDNQDNYEYVLTNESGSILADENNNSLVGNTEAPGGAFKVVLPKTTADLTITDGDYEQGSFAYEDFQFRYITGVKIIRTETEVTYGEITLTDEFESETITAVGITQATFISEVGANAYGTYQFFYNGTSWTRNGGNISLATYGISISGTATSGDSITVTFGQDVDETSVDKEYMVGTDIGNVYTIENNIFLTDKTSNELTTIATNLLNALSAFTYVPSTVVLPAHIGLQCGDVVAITAPDGTVIRFPVLQRVLSGIQGISVNVTAQGSADMVINANSLEAQIEAVRTSAYMSMSESKVARRAADDALKIANATNQHFWDDTQGIHISYQTKEEYYEGIAGKNLLANSNGILLREGTTVLAMFSPGEVQIGAASANHGIFDANGAYWYEANASDPYMEMANSTIKLGKDGSTVQVGMDFWNKVVIDTQTGMSIYSAGVLTGMFSSNDILLGRPTDGTDTSGNMLFTSGAETALSMFYSNEEMGTWANVFQVKAEVESGYFRAKLSLGNISGSPKIYGGTKGGQYLKFDSITSKFTGTVDIADDLTVTGDVISENIGDHRYGSKDNLTCHSGGYYHVGSVTLPAGVWILQGVVAFGAVNTSGIRRSFITEATFSDGTQTAPAGSAVITYDHRTPISNQNTYNRSDLVVWNTTKKTYYLVAYHSAGTDVGVNGRLYAVRIR